MNTNRTEKDQFKISIYQTKKLRENFTFIIRNPEVHIAQLKVHLHTKRINLPIVIKQTREAKTANLNIKE